MAIDTAGVAVTANTALANTVWDWKDESTGVQNTWTGNFGINSDPGGLCAEPPPPIDKPDDGKGHHHKKKHKKKDPCACTRHHPRAV
jgi:hypothetical protein